MAEVEISYNNSLISSMDASGTKTLKVGGKYVPYDIEVEYNKPSITPRTASDVTVSGNTVNIPAGIYSSNVSKSVANGAVTAPSSISGSSASVSAGSNTLTLSKSVSVTPNVTTQGYVTAGTAGNSNVSLTANVTTKGAATITPSLSDQSIASGTYLTGAQTFAALTKEILANLDSDFAASNIKKDVNILGLVGTYDGGGGGGIPAPTAGDTAVAAWTGVASVANTAVTQIGGSIKCPTAGTVTVKASGWRTSTSGTWSAQVYKNGSAVSGATATFNGNTWTLDKDITVAADDVLTIRGRSRGTSYTLYIFDIIASINWNNGYTVT